MSDPEAPVAAELRDTIRSFVHQRFPMAVTAEVGDDESLLDSGIVDSLGILDMVAFLEETFDVQIGDDDLNPENFDSVQSIASFVDSRR